MHSTEVEQNLISKEEITKCLLKTIVEENLMVTNKIYAELLSLRSEKQAIILSTFFKTKKGEYGEGDKFLGVKVPQIRQIVKRNKENVTIADIDTLTKSEWHEIRMAGFLLLVEIYMKSTKEQTGQNHLIKFYLSILQRSNNWDLVDLIAPKILGQWIVDNPKESPILYALAESDNLWEQRVAIVSTLTLIKNNRLSHTIQIAEKLLFHKHDLIHKAVGWLLREVGKKDIMLLEDFLQKNTSRMPRTSLRYAIERMPEEKRKYYMLMPKTQK